ncbi:C2 domain-containing protein-like protein [Tanacetum coccineum]
MKLRYSLDDGEAYEFAPGLVMLPELTWDCWMAESWFSVDAKEPVAYTLVEVVEALDMKPSDMNGLADPYVKGQLGAYRFRTKTQKKTLSPKWQEEFKIPITAWESPNLLIMQVRDKDHFVDDILGSMILEMERNTTYGCRLQNIKQDRLHITIEITEVDPKFSEPPCDSDTSTNELQETSFIPDPAQKVARAGPVADELEPIDVEGQRVTGIWVHHPVEPPKRQAVGPESPSKKKVKDVAKSILKHAGNSARSMKHALSGKGSKMRRDAEFLGMGWGYL